MSEKQGNTGTKDLSVTRADAKTWASTNCKTAPKKEVSLWTGKSTESLETKLGTIITHKFALFDIIVSFKAFQIRTCATAVAP
jgi:hypothetical protein